MPAALRLAKRPAPPGCSLAAISGRSGFIKIDDGLFGGLEVWRSAKELGGNLVVVDEGIVVADGWVGLFFQSVASGAALRRGQGSGGRDQGAGIELANSQNSLTIQMARRVVMGGICLIIFGTARRYNGDKCQVSPGLIMGQGEGFILQGYTDGF